MVRGITYDKQLFKSDDFSLMTKRFFNNTDGIVKGCTLATSGNTVTISTGWFVSSGYYNNISTQEVVSITQSGTLVYEIDLTKTNTSTEFNQGSFKIITTTPTEEDLFNGGTLYQMPVATVTTDGSSATIIETLWSDVKGDFGTHVDTLTFTINNSDWQYSSTMPNYYWYNVDKSLPTGYTQSNTYILSTYRIGSDNKITLPAYEVGGFTPYIYSELKIENGKLVGRIAQSSDNDLSVGVIIAKIS